MAEIRIQPASKIKGEWSPPGDKSVSHRAIIFGSIAKGTTKVTHFLEADDCLRTVEIAQQLGVNVERKGEGCFIVHGVGCEGLQEPGDVLDVGNSGTGLRLIAGVQAGQPIYSCLTGDSSIRKRPMKRVVEPLRRMGAVIDGRNKGNLAPLSIRGGNLKAISHHSQVASAQVKSCILLAGLFAEGVTEVTEPTLSRDHTERMFAGFGVELERSASGARMQGGQSLQGQAVIIPGDISSAAFFLIAALIVPNSELILKNVGTNPTRTGILDTLKSAGANIELVEERESGGEPTADLRVTTSALKPMQIGGDMIPRLVDEIPILAVAATQAQGETIISDAHELRIKESDRLATITQELRKMGAQIEETPDGLRIQGPTLLKGAEIDSHGDHRIAMSCAIAALIAEGETVIRNTECIETSFPTFEASLRKWIND